MRRRSRLYESILPNQPSYPSTQLLQPLPRLLLPAGRCQIRWLSPTARGAHTLQQCLGSLSRRQGGR